MRPPFDSLAHHFAGDGVIQCRKQTDKAFQSPIASISFSTSLEAEPLRFYVGTLQRTLWKGNLLCIRLHSKAG
jgi:hypothetical protein